MTFGKTQMGTFTNSEDPDEMPHNAADGRRPAVRFFLSFPQAGMGEINRIHHWCHVVTEKFQPEGPPIQWET